MEIVCFICGFMRKDFEQEEKSFDYHLEYEHDIWKYVNFMIYLKNKNLRSMTSIENKIFQKIHSKSSEWFPTKRTSYLSKST